MTTTPSRSGGGLRRPTPFRPASAEGPASPKAQAALAASPWARPKEETVRVDALPAGLRREVLDARQQDLVKAAVAAAARSWASVAKAPKAAAAAVNVNSTKPPPLPSPCSTFPR